MCQNEPWGAIAVPMEVRSTPITEKTQFCCVEVRRKGTRSTRSVEQWELQPLLPEGNSKNHAFRPKQGPADTARL